MKTKRATGLFLAMVLMAGGGVTIYKSASAGTRLWERDRELREWRCYYQSMQHWHEGHGPHPQPPLYGMSQRVFEQLHKEGLLQDMKPERE